jgi:hypothetical protein
MGARQGAKPALSVPAISLSCFRSVCVLASKKILLNRMYEDTGKKDSIMG